MMDGPGPASPPADADGQAHYDLSSFEELRAEKHFLLQRNLTNPEWCTLAILGTGRSGTTMTAGVLMLLGVEFGDRTDGRLGDKDISGCFREVYRSRLHWRILRLRHAFARVIRQRVGRWTRFAFKSPDLGPFLPLLSGALPAPVFIMSSRNLFETSFGFSRHVGGSWRTSFFTVTLIQCFLTAFALLTPKPILIFSYEAALKNPSRFVDELCRFLAISPSADARERAIRHIDPAPGYRQMRRINGHVDIATPGRLAGWVVDATDPEVAVTIRVESRGVTLASARADLPREDVNSAGQHATGDCGFDIRFQTELTSEQMESASIIVADADHVFWTKAE